MQKNNHRRHIRLVLSVILVLAATLSVAAQRRERTVDSWRPLHYDVDLSFNDQLSEITSARTAIQGTIIKGGQDKIDLDFGTMEIDSVSADGHQAMFAW